MSDVGILMLVHTALHRAEQVARFWARADCPVVIHVDKAVPRKTYNRLVQNLSDLSRVEFSRRHRCEWGTWGLVAATQDAAMQLLQRYPEVRHVMLTSGACLPLRPVEDLRAYLAARPRTDFIESATTSDVPWTVGGLDEERFTLRFPFSWRKHRSLFDSYVALQRKVGYKRRIPKGLVPHLGSQWWCLTRQTLTAILQDPDRARHDRYFAKVWIPDESYFQTLVRLYATDIESRSLTLSKFDFQGKPHVFYDDHLHLLRRSDCFLARKIWPRAEGLYDAFLGENSAHQKRTDPNPGKIDRVFARAQDRRTKGRTGLFNQSRFPQLHAINRITAGRYTVFQGFQDLFEDFDAWLASSVDARVHGALFAPDRAHFNEGPGTFAGAMSDNADLRDANPVAFLTNLLWNTRGQHQCFHISPRDNQKILPFIAGDNNATICIVSGAWTVPLFQSNADFADIRASAAKLQRIEDQALRMLNSASTKANLRVWTVAEFLDSPMGPLQQILDGVDGTRRRRLTTAPRIADLTGFGQFLQNLKNQGMHPYLAGDVPLDSAPIPGPDGSRKPYLIKT